jgi:hypothetical protein
MFMINSGHVPVKRSDFYSALSRDVRGALYIVGRQIDKQMARNRFLSPSSQVVYDAT